MYNKRGCLKRAPFLFWITVHFFCSSKRNEPKKRSPEKTTAHCLSSRYTMP